MTAPAWPAAVGRQARTRAYLAHVYLCGPIRLTAHEIETRTGHCAAIARDQGLALGHVFVEHLDAHDPAWAAYDALIDALVDGAGSVAAVIVPSMQHLAHFGLPASYVRRHLQEGAGVQVIVANELP